MIPLDEHLKEQLLRVSKATYGENGLLTSKGPTSHIISKYQISFSTHKINEEYIYKSSNYGLLASNREDAIDFQMAIKLYKDSWASINFGFSNDGWTHFVQPSYFGKQPCTLKEHELTALKQLINQIKINRSNQKFQLIMEKYRYALSTEISATSRFLELAIILEMIILPSNNSELRYRFSLRIAKLMHYLYSFDISATFNSAQAIYDTRSKIAHSGTSNSIKNHESHLQDIARHIIKAYINDNSLFEDKNLDHICLK